MHKAKSHGRRTASALVLVSLSLTLASCATVSEWWYGERQGAPAAAEGDTPLDNKYLSDMSELVSGDPARQAEIYADAAAAARLTPNTSSRLRYALVLATPGHPGADPAQAQRLLRDLVAEAELLTPVELSLATIHLGEVEARMMLDAERHRLRAESSRAADGEERAAAQRMAAIEAENRRLRESLAEAQEKLEAITSIERSIRESEDNDR